MTDHTPIPNAAEKAKAWDDAAVRQMPKRLRAYANDFYNDDSLSGLLLDSANEIEELRAGVAASPSEALLKRIQAITAMAGPVEASDFSPAWDALDAIAELLAARGRTDP